MLLYGRSPRLASPQPSWDDESSLPLVSGRGEFCLDHESRRLLIREPDSKPASLSLPDGVEELEEVGLLHGWALASWPDPSIFQDGIRVLGFAQLARARSSEIREFVSTPRHSQSFLSRGPDGKLRFSYVSRNGGLHIDELGPGGLTQDGKAGLAWKIHEMRSEGGRNLMLISSALGAPQGLHVYDIDRRQKVAGVELRNRDDFASMSTMADGTPVISAIDRDETLSVYVNNERIAHFQGASSLPVIKAARSWMTRDQDGAAYVAWCGAIDDGGAEIHAARISLDDRSQYRVETKVVANTDFSTRPVLTTGRSGLYIGWAATVLDKGPLPANEVWFGTGEQSEWSPSEEILAI